MDQLAGRLLLKRELKEYDEKKLICCPAMTEIKQTIKCNRCQSLHQKNTVRLPAGYYYCPTCLLLGRVTSLDELCCLKAEDPQKSREVFCAWSGTLSCQQQKIAEGLTQNLPTSLVWAVAGAGKTEMLFPVITQTLTKGGRVGIASPRIDVCNELYPRLTKAFPKEVLCLLHGSVEKGYHNTNFVVCTTHQLLRFYQAFDLLIIDEADAFPYEGDPMLAQAVTYARKKVSQLIYLTATPSDYLLKGLPSDTGIYRLPARYHRRKLPVPQFIFWQRITRSIAKGKLPKKVKHTIGKLVEKNHLLIFCPSISLMGQLAELLKKLFPARNLTHVWAKAEGRIEKVYQMREGKYDILLTTTILERGVTFENISVIVIQADHAVFTKSALVQIAGRVDRKQTVSCGQVVFFAEEWCSTIKKAIQEIEDNNRQAKEMGLLDEV